MAARGGAARGWAQQVRGWAQQVRGWAQQVGGWAQQVGGGCSSALGVCPSVQRGHLRRHLPGWEVGSSQQPGSRLPMPTACARTLRLPPPPPPPPLHALPLLGCAGLALLKEFEEGLSRCTGIYVDELLGRAVPPLVGCGMPWMGGGGGQRPPLAHLQLPLPTLPATPHTRAQHRPPTPAPTHPPTPHPAAGGVCEAW